jgi:hypothetical protein
MFVDLLGQVGNEYIPVILTGIPRGCTAIQAYKSATQEKPQNSAKAGDQKKEIPF